MRIRTIKPETWASLTVAKLSPWGRLMWIGLWNYADDEGRGIWDARLIKAALFPLDDFTVAKVQKVMDEVSAGCPVTLYEWSAKPLFEIRSWAEHQRIPPTKLKPSVYPSAAECLRQGSETALQTGKGREQGTGNGERKGVALAERDQLFEAVAEVCGIDWHDLTDSARGSLNKAVAQLRGTHADPDEVRRRARNWPALFDPDTTLTPSALAKHWPALGTARSTPGKSSKLLALADRLEN